MGLMCINVPMILFRNGETIAVNYKFLFDTGTPFAFAITDPPLELQNFVGSIDYTDKPVLLAQGSQAVKSRRFFNLDSILFCGYTIKNAPALFSYERSFAKWMKNGTIGTIGMDIFKHFNTIIDFYEQKIILKAHHKDFPYQISHL